MSELVMELNNMIEGLEEADVRQIITFVGFLSDQKKKKEASQNIEALKEMQELFKDDKGWASEEEMIADLKAFRKQRMQA